MKVKSQNKMMTQKNKVFSSTSPFFLGHLLENESGTEVPYELVRIAGILPERTPRLRSGRDALLP